MMESEIRCFVGKKIADTYGRQIGRVIGVSTDVNGDLQTLQVEQASRILCSYPARQAVLHEADVVLLPEWKEELETLLKEYKRCGRREQAIQELTREGQLSADHEAHILSETLSHLKVLESSKEYLTRKLKVKLNEIDGHLKDLAQFLVNLKLGVKLNEFGQESYVTAVQAVQPTIDAYRAERTDVERSLEKLMGLQIAKLPVEEAHAATHVASIKVERAQIKN